MTPVGTFLQTTATSVVAPGTEGYLGVLPGHLPLLTSLRPGLLTVTATGVRRTMRIGAGYMEVAPSSVIIITETAAYI